MTKTWTGLSVANSFWIPLKRKSYQSMRTWPGGNSMAWSPNSTSPILAEAGVAADLDQELLAVARGVVAAVGFDAHVIAKRAVEEDVVPAADVERWDLDVGEVLFDGPLLPIGVVTRVGKPIEVVGGDGFRDVRAGRESFVIEGGELRERKRGGADEGVGVLFNFAPHRVGGELSGPVLIEPLFERAAVIGPVRMVIAGCHGGHYAGEVRRLRDRGEHLRGADVGAAGHADFAIRIRKRSGPFDGVVAVGDLVPEGVELAVGGVTAADVLHDHDVAVRGD